MHIFVACLVATLITYEVQAMIQKVSLMIAKYTQFPS